MRPKVVLAAFTVMVALGGWATTEAADRDDNYPNGYYYYHPDRSRTYYYRHYPDRSYTYYRDGRDYSYYVERPHRYRYDYYSYNRVDPYGIERHDTN